MDVSAIINNPSVTVILFVTQSLDVWPELNLWIECSGMHI